MCVLIKTQLRKTHKCTHLPELMTSLHPDKPIAIKNIVMLKMYLIHPVYQTL